MTAGERVKLSKTMSYLLRHRPDAAGLALDSAGLVPLQALVAALRTRRGYEWVTERDVREVVETSDKQRFRIEGELIGARYGHNLQVSEVAPGEPVEPPELLYHGTPRSAVASILAIGLQSRGRQFVHLSATPNTALAVGQRRDREPAMLVIRAAAAHADGIAFYAPTPEIYLVRHVPPAYLSVSTPAGE